MNPLMQLKITTLSLLVQLVFVCFAFSPQARAACDSPDPGCPGGNLAEGYLALAGLTTGAYNTGIGTYALLSITDGSLCTGVGAGALFSNSAANNTATGAGTLFSNTIGEGNTATGAFALFSNTEGPGNTAVGLSALLSNTTGSFNTAIGVNALSSNTETFGNTAIGYEALLNNAAAQNTAIGYQALLNNINGAGNTALGWSAGSNLTQGDQNVCIGWGVGGAAGESNRIRIANNLPTGAGQSACYIGGIAGQTVGAGGANCVVDNDGKLGVFLSARRFKENIKRMDEVSTALFSLKPVTFRYKPELDKSGTPHFGLVAEEVAEVSPDLVNRDAKGEISTVRYDAVNAMLLNEFLKEHGKVEKLEATVAQQQKQIEALTMGLQKVSAQLELSKPAPQTVLNNQ